MFDTDHRPPPSRNFSRTSFLSSCKMEMRRKEKKRTAKSSKHTHTLTITKLHDPAACSPFLLALRLLAIQQHRPNTNLQVHFCTQQMWNVCVCVFALKILLVTSVQLKNYQTHNSMSCMRMCDFFRSLSSTPANAIANVWTISHIIYTQMVGSHGVVSSWVNTEHFI